VNRVELLPGTGLSQFICSGVLPFHQFSKLAIREHDIKARVSRAACCFRNGRRLAGSLSLKKAADLSAGGSERPFKLNIRRCHQAAHQSDTKFRSASTSMYVANSATTSCADLTPAGLSLCESSRALPFASITAMVSAGMPAAPAKSSRLIPVKGARGRNQTACHFDLGTHVQISLEASADFRGV
jgi:hypothetical protein